ncbi:LuxR C-terminal-related transcriptional regulator [Streptomyces xiangluensis]|uniref:LuxR C-terminal-related transcriptional regulator n=1 Tax=Streptomyces xiangluensis TaxID=2665720 RepID=A0ABV8YWD6_9ACTN
MVRVVWPESLPNMFLTTAYWSLGAAIAVTVGLRLRSMDSAALKRIEEAGQRALASMDRAVHMLRGTDDEPAACPAPPPVPTLAELPALVGHFAAMGPASPRLRVDRQAAAASARETATTAYRAVTEALTNIRRHAPTATQVEISIGSDDAVARLVAEGRTNAEIGTALFITSGTAKTHVANIQRKLGVRNRVGIAAWAWRNDQTQQ